MTKTLLKKIASNSTRQAIAKTYALALESSEKTDWLKVNQAITDKLGSTALNWIKVQALKLSE